MKPYLFTMLMFFSSCMSITGCGDQAAGLVVDPMDEEGIAEYERMIAEQQMSPGERTKITEEMMTTENR